MESNASYKISSKGGMKLHTSSGDETLLVRSKDDAKGPNDYDTFQFILTEYGFFIHALRD